MTVTVAPTALGRMVATRGVQAGIRIAIPVAAMSAHACTVWAAGDAAPLVGLVVFALAIVCTLAPDSHLGLLVTVIVGVHWLIAVEDVGTPWSVGAGASLGVFHAAMAAATVGPPSARWTSAMVRRWSLRTALALVGSPVVWAAVSLVGASRSGGNDVLLVAALAGLAVAATWVRARTLGRADP